jgi:hypothetical protein
MSDLTKHDDDQKLRDIAAGLDVEEGIRQGLDDGVVSMGGRNTDSKSTRRSLKT